MTSQRNDLALVGLYWLCLLLGMGACALVRDIDPLMPIWTGAIIGTAVGHGLALANRRTWLALVVITVFAAMIAPADRRDTASEMVCLAFLPAALCAFWSLGDRTTLVGLAGLLSTFSLPALTVSAWACSGRR
jgi:hypothetical protein